MKRWISLFAVLALAVARPLSSTAAGFIIVVDTSWQPGPNPPSMPPWPEHRIRPPQPHAFAPLEVASVKVNTRIRDQVATTAVDQEFYNPNNARLEGTFVFPVPKGAHIDKFTMEIDGKQVQAELLAADKARGIYEDIVRKMKDPALLEYAGQDIFKVRIFPIEPRSRKRVTLSYTQVLTADSGLVSYTLPLGTQKFSSKPVHNVSVKVDLDTKRPLKSIYSPSHAVEIKRDGSRHATAGYEATDVSPDADFALYFAPEQDEIGLNLLTYRTPGEDGYFLLLASPGMDVEEKQVVSKDVVFVLDTSGSMAGAKLEQAKKAMLFCIENLNDGDRFEILRFSTEVEPLFNKLVTADRKNRNRAETFVTGLRPIGGTAIDDALRKALALRPSSSQPFQVIFLTDGQPTIGTTDIDQIVINVNKLSEGRTRVFSFGIGTDVNTHLLDRITEATRGFSQYVLPQEDIEVKVSSFFSKIKDPVLANPELKFTGDIHVSKLYPSPLPDLFKGQQLVLVGRYSGNGPSAIEIEGAINGRNKKFTYEAKFPKKAGGNEFIPRLWATRRVGYLLDEIRLHGENSELRDEVTELARRYGIVTPYTAYLIVEDESRRGVAVQSQSLPGLDQDRAARQVAKQTYDSYKKQTVGDKALGGARASAELKTAAAPMPTSPAGSSFGGAGGMAESRRLMGMSANGSANQPAAKDKERALEYSQQFRFVAGKNFFQNDKQWVDSEVQKHPKAKSIRLQLGSKEYFDFAAKHPETLAWLALGANTRFYLEETVYEVGE